MFFRRMALPLHSGRSVWCCERKRAGGKTFAKKPRTIKPGKTENVASDRWDNEIEVLRKATSPGQPTRSSANGLLEFASRSGLFQPDPAGGDASLEVILPLYGGTSEAAEHGDLADVSQRVSDGALKQAFV
jgi:hypothetical protein